LIRFRINHARDFEDFGGLESLGEKTLDLLPQPPASRLGTRIAKAGIPDGVRVRLTHDRGQHWGESSTPLFSKASPRMDYLDGIK
jgi:hypothetical protein